MIKNTPANYAGVIFICRTSFYHSLTSCHMRHLQHFDSFYIYTVYHHFLTYLHPFIYSCLYLSGQINNTHNTPNKQYASIRIFYFAVR